MPRPVKHQPVPSLLTLKKFLLEGSLPELAGQPLFESLSDLARATRQHEVDPPGFPSVVSMIQQGLTGKRSFKRERAIAMRQAVTERIHQRAPEHADELSKQFDYCFDFVDAYRQHPYETHGKTGGLNPAGKGVTFVIAPYVQDVIDSSGGRNMIRAFVVTHGLHGREVPTNQQSRYLLAFSSEEDLFLFLAAVVSETISEELGDRPIRAEYIERVMMRLEVDERRQNLSYAILPKSYCLSATVVYDCEAEEGSTFALSYGDATFHQLPLRGVFRKGYRQLYFDLHAGTIVGARFISAHAFHEKIMYQLLSGSAVV
jgi:hypothetical protein